METERRARIIASVSTAIIAGLVLFLLSVIYLSAPAKDTPEKADILLLPEEEEFVEVIEPTYSPVKESHEDATSYLLEPETNHSQPTPPSGTDLKDAGKKSDSEPPVMSSKEPSPVKVKTEKPKDPGPKVDAKKQEEEAVKRQAENEVANAFKNASGRHNAATSGTDIGNSGTNQVTPGSQGTTGHGSGTVGGGWIIPKYAPVKSTVTGSVKMIVKIDASGRVQSVTFNGGDPPAATNPQVRAAVEREIRAHKFSRSNPDGAESATAYITYIFK